MRRGIVAALLAIGLVALPVVLWQARRIDVDAASRRPAPAISASADGLRRAEAAPAAYPSRRRFRVGDPGVESLPDIAWMERNLYPTADEERVAGQDLLHFSAGDFEGPLSPAMLAKAERCASVRFQPELHAQAVARLDEAAVDGSIYALRALQRVYSMPPMRDRVKSEMFGQAAWLRGDWSSPSSGGLPEAQQARAGLGAQRWLVDADRRRRARGLPPLGRDPKPGLVELHDAVERAARRLSPASAR